MKMPIIDANGFFKTDGLSLKVQESEHPVYKARVAIALEKGSWLYAPENGHELSIYSRQKATPEKIEEFQKNAKLYLSPYTPEVVSRFIQRGELTFKVNIPEE